MSDIVRTLIFFDADPDAEADAHSICGALEALGVSARAVSQADLKRAGFACGKTDLLSLDFSFLGIDINLVQVFCLFRTGPANSAAYLNLEKAVKVACPKAKRYGRGRFYIEPGRTPRENAGAIIKYLNKTDLNLKGFLESLGDGAESDPAQLPLISYRYDLYLSHLCRMLDPSSEKAVVEASLKDMCRYLEKRIALLVPPYDTRKFSMASIPAIKNLLRGFETYGAGYDDPLVSALRVLVNFLLCRTHVRYLAAVKLLCGKSGGDERYSGAVRAWDELCFSGSAAGINGPAFSELELFADREYQDLCRCDTAFRFAMNMAVQSRCPGVSESSSYGFSYDDLMLFEKARRYRVPTFAPEPASVSDTATDADRTCAKDAFSEFAAHQLELCGKLYSLNESFLKDTLDCFCLFAQRGAALSSRIGADELKRQFSWYAGEADRLRSERPGGPADLNENALRAALGCTPRGEADGRYDVFISYRRQQNDCENELPRRLYNRIRAYPDYPLVPFLDVIELKKNGSSEFRAALDDALDRSDNLVLLIRDKLDPVSEWVRHEWSGFLWDCERGRKRGSLYLMMPSELAALQKTEGFLPEFLTGHEIFEYSENDVTAAADRLCGFISSNRSTYPAAAGSPGTDTEEA